LVVPFSRSAHQIGVTVSKPSSQPDVERYAAQLDEAQQIKGVSLGRDAWRRLRKNRLAMFSLGFLVWLGLCAVFTPLLPLQPPQLVATDHKYEAPVAFKFEKTLNVVDANGELLPDTPGFGRLNAFDRGLLRLRVAIFGEWQISSICGRDELGRD